MELGKEYRCHVFLAYEAAQLVDTIKNTTDFMEKTIHMSETMTVELTNSTEPPTFKIKALSANTQLIDESSPTEWQFLMTPLHENNQSLVLRIIRTEYNNGEERQKEVVYEQNVEVIAPVEEKKEAEYLGPMDEETKQQIRDLISRAKLEEAIDRFKKWADENGDEDLKNTLLMLSAKFNNFQRNQNMGLIDAKDADIERNRITHAILSTLDEAEIVKVKAKPASETSPKGDNDSEKEGKTILFMGATPHGVGSLQLEIEHSKIAATLNDKFNFPVAKFLKADEMPKLFIQHKPNIVHFSVSGKNSESDNDSNVEQDKSLTLGHLPKDYAEKGGIVVFSEDMRSLQIIEDKVLDYLFSSAVNKLGIPIEVVVLSRCFSESQAKIIGKYVPYVVGTMNTIDDKSAIEFAEGFYSGISKGLTIEDAYTSGKMQAVIQDVEAEDLFMIYKKGERLDI